MFVKIRICSPVGGFDDGAGPPILSVISRQAPLARLTLIINIVIINIVIITIVIINIVIILLTIILLIAMRMMVVHFAPWSRLGLPIMRTGLRAQLGA